MPKLLGQNAAKYPNVDISVTIANTEEIAQDLRLNHLDIGIVEGKDNPDDFLVEKFMDDEMVLIVPNDHPLAKAKATGIEQL